MLDSTRAGLSGAGARPGVRRALLAAVAAVALLAAPGESHAGVTVSSGNINLAIPDKPNSDPATPSAFVETTIDVPASTTPITDLNVQIRINHTKTGDLDVFLFHPDGTKLELFTDVGGSGDNFGSGSNDCNGTPTTLDSQSPTTIKSPSVPPYAGTYAPEFSLAKFNGKQRTGAWKLRIEDDDPLNTGTLFCWKLLFDSDTDGDGVLDGPDNCTYVANANQLNTDGDAEGNACDADDDNDLVADIGDNCPLVSNPDQTDTDGDGIGDACDDADADRDGVADYADNCPTVPNADQTNTDKNMAGGDDLGDACDPDDDADGLSDADEAAKGSNPLNPDTDGDGRKDGADNCPAHANASQADFDNDGMGDPCDPDDDNDGLADTEEAAYGTDPKHPDKDRDGVSDGDEVHVYGSQPLDPDTDGDLHKDGTEVAAGSDPANPFSVPGPSGPVTVADPAPVSEMPVTDIFAPVR